MVMIRKISPEDVRTMPLGTEIRIVSRETGTSNSAWVAERNNTTVLMDAQHYVSEITEREGFHYEVFV